MGGESSGKLEWTQIIKHTNQGYLRTIVDILAVCSRSSSMGHTSDHVTSLLVFHGSQLLLSPCPLACQASGLLPFSSLFPSTYVLQPYTTIFLPFPLIRFAHAISSAWKALLLFDHMANFYSSYKNLLEHCFCEDCVSFYCRLSPCLCVSIHDYIYHMNLTLVWLNSLRAGSISWLSLG